MLKELAWSQGHFLDLQDAFKGGRTFGQHLRLSVTDEKIREGRYEYVFLQNQSQTNAWYWQDRKGKAGIMDDLEFEKFSPAHQADLKSLIREAAWSVPDQDIDFISECDRCGLLLAYCHGELAGSAGRGRYEESRKIFINDVIVRQKFRRQGFAARLCRQLFAMNPGWKSYRLYASEMGVPVYKSLDFKERGKIIVYQGNASDALKLGDPSRTEEIVELPSWIVRQDAAGFAGDRDFQMRDFLRHSTGGCRMLGSRRGFVFDRGPGPTQRVVMLEAADLTDALDLFAASVYFGNRCRPVEIFVPEKQTDFAACLAGAGFKSIFSLLDMESGEASAEFPDFYRGVGGLDIG